MRVHPVSGHVPFAAVVVIAGMLSIACGREPSSMTAPARPLTAVSAASSAFTYAWSTSCSISIGSSSFIWSFQLADGSTAGGGSVGCTSASGTGTIPLTAVAITVYGDVFGDLSGCEDSKTVTKAVSSSGNASVSMKLSLPSQTGTIGGTVACPTGGASFKIGNN